MRWEDGRRSDNVEDRRGQSPRSGIGRMAAAPLVLFRFLPALVRSKSGRTILIVGIVLVFGSRMLGIDLMSMFVGGGVQAPAGTSQQISQEEQELADFVSVVLADTEDTWHRIFSERGGRYREPTLVLFSDSVSSACGMASAAVGPFYCPGDQKLYVDLSFFRELKARAGARSDFDFAQAYVLAHEIGHHVQTLTGISQQVQKLGRGKPQAQVNALSVRQELQADCYAGVWGHHSGIELERGDMLEAVQAAAAIGDDRLQREAGRRVRPDSFTHGTSEQRVQWLRQGLESGDLAACDTFSSR
jgi:predicted metalloprotease